MIALPPTSPIRLAPAVTTAALRTCLARRQHGDDSPQLRQALDDMDALLLPEAANDAPVISGGDAV